MTEFRNSGRRDGVPDPTPHLPVVVSNPADRGMPGSMALAAPLVGLALFGVLLAFSLHHGESAPGQTQTQAPASQQQPATTGSSQR